MAAIEHTQFFGVYFRDGPFVDFEGGLETLTPLADLDIIRKGIIPVFELYFLLELPLPLPPKRSTFALQPKIGVLSHGSKSATKLYYPNHKAAGNPTLNALTFTSSSFLMKYSSVLIKQLLLL